MELYIFLLKTLDACVKFILGLNDCTQTDTHCLCCRTLSFHLHFSVQNNTDKRLIYIYIHNLRQLNKFISKRMGYVHEKLNLNLFYMYFGF